MKGSLDMVISLNLNVILKRNAKTQNDKRKEKC